MHEDFNTPEQLQTRRDDKAKPHLQQYAPVWLIQEDILLEDEVILFTVMFEHPSAGWQGKPAWVQRRYRYDSFNDVLHHRGQKAIDEEDAVEQMDADPYLEATITDIPNSYGG